MLRHLLILLVFFTFYGANASTFDAYVIAVNDGDTIKVITDCNGGDGCKNGKMQHRIRLAEIDAPEVGSENNIKQGQPYGRQSKRYLADLVLKTEVKVSPLSEDKYGRMIAHIHSADVWINKQMVATGHAWVYRSYLKTTSLLDVEKKARNDKQGLWSLTEGERIPPWEWRKIYK